MVLNKTQGKEKRESRTPQKTNTEGRKEGKMVESYQEMQERRKEEQKRREARRDMLYDLSDKELGYFIRDMHRAETDENKRVYIKGIRSCLIALGYSEEWVNGPFYERILEEY